MILGGYSVFVFLHTFGHFMNFKSNNFIIFRNLIAKDRIFVTATQAWTLLTRTLKHIDASIRNPDWANWLPTLHLLVFEYGARRAKGEQFFQNNLELTLPFQIANSQYKELLIIEKAAGVRFCSDAVRGGRSWWRCCWNVGLMYGVRFDCTAADGYCIP